MIIAVPVYQASAGCGRWVVRETTDYLTDPLFDEEVKASTGPNASVNAESSAKQSNEIEKKTDDAAKTNAKTALTKKPAIDLAGKWRIYLEMDRSVQDSGNSLDLILIQSGERLQGYGTVVEKGTDIPATATGSISKDTISLDIKLTPQKKDYRLVMDLVGNTLNGYYELYEADKLAEKGNATAQRSGS
jgi:hypothetical protein